MSFSVRQYHIWNDIVVLIIWKGMSSPHSRGRARLKIVMFLDVGRESYETWCQSWEIVELGCPRNDRHIHRYLCTRAHACTTLYSTQQKQYTAYMGLYGKFHQPREIGLTKLLSLYFVTCDYCRSIFVHNSINMQF